MLWEFMLENIKIEKRCWEGSLDKCRWEMLLGNVVSFVVSETIIRVMLLGSTEIEKEEDVLSRMGTKRKILRSVLKVWCDNKMSTILKN